MEINKKILDGIKCLYLLEHKMYTGLLLNLAALESV